MSGLKTGDFLARTAVITVSAVIVILCINIWIIKPLQSGGEKAKPYNFSSEHLESSKAVVSHPKTDFTKDKKTIDWKNAAKYIGDYVEVEGKIVSSYNTGKVCFLNFHKDYMNHLTLVVFAGDYKRFPAEPDRIYTGKTVKAEGRVKLYKGRVEIIVKSPEQIKIIN